MDGLCKSGGGWRLLLSDVQRRKRWRNGVAGVSKGGRDCEYMHSCLYSPEQEIHADCTNFVTAIIMYRGKCSNSHSRAVISLSHRETPSENSYQNAQ